MKTIYQVIIILTAFLIILAVSLTPTKHPTPKQEKIKVSEVNKLKITVIVDNNPGNRKLMTAWGISMLIEVDGKKLLFDTGPDPYTLEHNSRQLGIDITEINAVIISHEHGDHTGGLPYIAEMNPNTKVYIPSKSSRIVIQEIRNMGLKVIEVEKPMEIFDGVATIGELYGPPYEQSLIVNVKGKGLIVIVGCSHPKIEKIVSYAHNITGKPIYAVIGGFHLGGASEYRLRRIVETFLNLDIKEVYPLHCTGENAREYFKMKLGERYRDGGVGLIIEF